jgi:hypothetical protein
MRRANDPTRGPLGGYSRPDITGDNPDSCRELLVRHSIAPTFVRQYRVANVIVSHVFSGLKAVLDHFPQVILLCFQFRIRSFASVFEAVRRQSLRPARWACAPGQKGCAPTNASPGPARRRRRILRGARRDENSCLISPLAPSQKRPCVGVGGIAVKATRVVMAVHLGRPIEADEDIHHERCRNGRCVKPLHLAVISAAAHMAHHGAERRLERCPRHGTPYERRDSWGYLLAASVRPRRRCDTAGAARLPTPAAHRRAATTT